MRHTRSFRIVAVVTALALFGVGIGPLVQHACASMQQGGPQEDVCLHHSRSSGDAPSCPHVDSEETGETVAGTTMTCCGAATWNEVDAPRSSRLDGASLNGVSIRSVRAPGPVPDEEAGPAVAHRAPAFAARIPLFLRHDTFLE